MTTLTAKDYKDIWKQWRVGNDAAGAGARLKKEMGDTTSPDKLQGIVTGGAAAMAGTLRWDDALEIAANTLVTLCTVQHETQEQWLAAFDRYIAPKAGTFKEAFSKEFKQNQTLGKSASDLVAIYRRDIVKTVVEVFRMCDSPQDTLSRGENAVKSAYKNMYSTRQGSYFKSIWATTDTESHLASVWGAIVALRVGVDHELKRLDAARQEAERQRIAMERARVEAEDTARRERKRILPVQRIADGALPYDRENKLKINDICDELLKEYPSDIPTLHDDELSRRITIRTQKTFAKYGYQMSGNWGAVKNRFESIVETARQKHYPVTDEALLKVLMDLAISAQYTNTTGSDNADKPAADALARR
ncbi:hypothetical protein [Myxococcus faecalis]|uniref:hypothetical protein n=1 Tax=Myxococcus faecalis TaxID=3115646 RepID=UPI003CF50000